MHAGPCRWFLAAVLLAAPGIGCSGDDSSPGSGAGGAGATATTGTSTTTGQGGSTATGGGAPGGSGGGYVPDPIPAVDEEPPAACPEALSTPDYFQFLDNLCDEKRLPSFVDRDLACPVVDASATVTLAGGGAVTYQPWGAAIEVDATALAGIVPDALDVTVILIRRVGGVPHYRYLSNGSHDVAFQPWSSTKFLAAANAAGTLREASSYDVGLTASVDGYPLGDLVTSLVNYDYDPFSSNGLGRYFHDIGGHAKANDLVHGLWLGRPASETFGGNYGAAEPPLSFSFVEPGGASVTIDPDLGAGPSNHLSSFTTAEALRRLVLHREEAATRLPGIQWKDLRVLFYGAEGSGKYGEWGGMSADTAIYLQTGHDIDYLEARSQGRWRVFSKLGLGTGGEFVDVGYGCFPVLDPDAKPVPGWGRELVVSAHLPTGGATWAERDRMLAKAYRAVVARVVDGRL